MYVEYLFRLVFVFVYRFVYTSPQLPIWVWTKMKLISFVKNLTSTVCYYRFHLFFWSICARPRRPLFSGRTTTASEDDAPSSGAPMPFWSAEVCSSNKGIIRSLASPLRLVLLLVFVSLVFTVPGVSATSLDCDFEGPCLWQREHGFVLNARKNASFFQRKRMDPPETDGSRNEKGLYSVCCRQHLNFERSTRVNCAK